ncbi:MAG: DUF4062 domain-containing protein, partial [Blastocatellia bacterium]
MESASQQVSVIRVFIASPRDLADERLKFRDVVEEVNRIKAGTIGIQLIPLGWEDVLPGRGRPQALINEDVKSCDLFVLLLWKRWGTPSGGYTSGTEEEFELARKLSDTQSGKPSMMLYFKDVLPDMLSDPGPQLKQILEFRSKVEQEKSFLY